MFLELADAWILILALTGAGFIFMNEATQRAKIRKSWLMFAGLMLSSWLIAFSLVIYSVYHLVA